MQKEKILVLAPHTDDAEFGCGGSIVKFVEEGCEVNLVAFSTCEESVPKNLPKNILAIEAKASAEKMKINELVLLNYKVRYFSENRQSILEDMVKLKKQFSPSIVLIPNSNDIHQDHQTIHNEAKRAFKTTKMLGYELPWNNFTMTTNFHNVLSLKHIEKKIESVLCYKSQAHRDYYSEEFVKSLAYTRGTQIGVHYAEAFEVIRWINF
jgi:N-acetylglucosamine malate deacetylase 1